MRILVLCDATMAGASVARCLSETDLTIVTAGKTHLSAMAEESILTFSYDSPDKLLMICLAADINAVIPPKMSILADIAEQSEDLPLILVGCPSGDPFSRETLWEAVKAAGLKILPLAETFPAIYWSQPGSALMRLSINSQNGFDAMSKLTGTLFADPEDMTECQVDFFADMGKLLAAACRDCLVMQGDVVRVSEVHELSDEMTKELQAILAKLEYSGPGTLTCFVKDKEILWADLNVCINEGMEISAASGLNIPAIALAYLLDELPDIPGLVSTTVTREYLTLYHSDEED